MSKINDSIQNKPENELKVRLLQYLISNWKLDQSAVLASEMPIDRYRARVDIALFTNKAYGFEIKSKSDSLSRLNKQLDTYKKLFDKTIIVADRSHEKGILKVIDEETGLWLVDDDKIIIKKRGRLKKIGKNSDFLQLMNQTCRKNFCSNNNIRHTGLKPEELENAILKFNAKTHHKHILNWFSSKYSTTSDRFWKELKASVNYSSLQYLSPHYTKRVALKKNKEQDIQVWEQWRAKLKTNIDDIHMLHWFNENKQFSKMPFGTVPADIQSLLA